MTQDFDWREYLRTFAGSGRPTLPVNTIQLAKNFHKYDRDTQTVTCTLCGWSCTNIEDIEVREIKCPHRKDNNDDDSSCGHARMERLHQQNSHHEEKLELEPGASHQPNLVYPDLIYPEPMRNLTMSQAQMKDEHNRKYTFSNWPKAAPVSGDALAASGFFFIGPVDRVKCAFCQKKIKNWMYGDDAVMEHKRLSPFCSFASNLEDVPGRTSQGYSVRRATTWETDDCSNHNSDVAAKYESLSGSICGMADHESHFGERSWDPHEYYGDTVY